MSITPVIKSVVLPLPLCYSATHRWTIYCSSFAQTQELLESFCLWKTFPDQLGLCWCGDKPSEILSISGPTYSCLPAWVSSVNFRCVLSGAASVACVCIPFIVYLYLWSQIQTLNQQANLFLGPFWCLPSFVSLADTESLYAKTILCMRTECLNSSLRGNPKHIYHHHHDNQG